MDVRHAFRRLTATPLLSLGAMLTLALGIGSAVVMVDILDRLLLRAPAGVTEPDRVARVYFGIGPQSVSELCSYARFESLAGISDSLEASAACFNEQLTLGRGERARQLQVVAVTSEYFAALGVVPYLGSWPPSTSDTSAVISYGLWRQEFGAAPDVVGKTLRLGLDTYDIAAIAPPGFAGIDVKAADVWLPFARAREIDTAPNGRRWRSPYEWSRASVQASIEARSTTEPAHCGFRMRWRPGSARTASSSAICARRARLASRLAGASKC